MRHRGDKIRLAAQAFSQVSWASDIATTGGHDAFQLGCQAGHGSGAGTKYMTETFASGLQKRFAITIAVELLLVGFLIAGIAYVLQIRAVAQSETRAVQELRRALPATLTPSTDAKSITKSILSHFYYPDLAIAVAKGDVLYKGQTSVLLSPPSRSFVERTAQSIADIAGLESQSVQAGNATIVVGANSGVLVGLAGRLAAMLAAVTVLSGLLARGAARRLTKCALEPLYLVTDELESLAGSNRTPRRIETVRSDEFGRLVRAYNSAFDTVIGALSERAQAENRMQQFTADAAHQLRTPLTVLRGFIGILRKGQLKAAEDYERILDTMNRQSDAMATLVDKLIDLPRLDEHAGKVESVDVAELVQHIVAPLAGANPHRDLRLDIRNAARADVIKDDLSYAVTNLVDNALKYAPQGEITVSVDREDTSVKITVADRGPGIPQGHLERIFDRFYRGEQREVTGSGLGLAIAKRAVERAHGTISVESLPSFGTRFTIALPARKTTAQRLRYGDDELCVA